MKKIGRNDPCHCKSGKKFKKCCESKMIGGRYMATKIDALAASQLTRTSGLSGLFNRQISAIAKPTEAHKPIRVSGPSAPSISSVPAAVETPVLAAVVTEKVESKENLC